MRHRASQQITCPGNGRRTPASNTMRRPTHSRRGILAAVFTVIRHHHDGNGVLAFRDLPQREKSAARRARAEEIGEPRKRQDSVDHCEAFVLSIIRDGKHIPFPKQSAPSIVRASKWSGPVLWLECKSIRHLIGTDAIRACVGPEVVSTCLVRSPFINVKQAGPLVQSLSPCSIGVDHVRQRLELSVTCRQRQTLRYVTPQQEERDKHRSHRVDSPPRPGLRRSSSSDDVPNRQSEKEQGPRAEQGKKHHNSGKAEDDVFENSRPDCEREQADSAAEGEHEDARQEESASA